MMPTFAFKPPNIHPVAGAVWTHRDKLPGKDWSEPVSRTDVPAQRIKSSQGTGGPLIAEYRPPPNVGRKFYATLRRLDYHRGEGGDYHYRLEPKKEETRDRGMGLRSDP